MHLAQLQVQVGNSAHVQSERKTTPERASALQPYGAVFPKDALARNQAQNNLSYSEIHILDSQGSLAQ